MNDHNDTAASFLQFFISLSSLSSVVVTHHRQLEGDFLVFLLRIWQQCDLIETSCIPDVFLNCDFLCTRVDESLYC
jgi:hypothetical protein